MSARNTPNVLLHHFKHNKILHQQVVILSITTDAVPEVPEADRVRIKSFGQGFWGVTAHCGFKESPDVIAGRMEKAAGELSHFPEYDYVVINRDLDKSIEKVRMILAAERQRRDRITGLVEFARGLQEDA